MIKSSHKWVRIMSKKTSLLPSPRSGFCSWFLCNFQFQMHIIWNFLTVKFIIFWYVVQISYKVTLTVWTFIALSIELALKWRRWHNSARDIYRTADISNYTRFASSGIYELNHPPFMSSTYHFPSFYANIFELLHVLTFSQYIDWWASSTSTMFYWKLNSFPFYLS